jgi:hypothetical protein
VIGLGLPLVIALVFMLGGVLLMVLWRLFGPEPAREFFRRRPFEHVPHDVAVGGGTVEAVGVSEEAADAGLGPGDPPEDRP